MEFKINKISNAPCFVQNKSLHNDFNVTKIKHYINILIINFFDQIKNAISAQYFHQNMSLILIDLIVEVLTMFSYKKKKINIL